MGRAPELEDRSLWAFWAGTLMVFIYAQPHLAILSGYGSGAADGALIRAAYPPAYLCALFLAASAPLQTGRAVLVTPLLGALLLLAAMSWVWSVDPSATIRRFVAVAFTTLGALSLAARFRWPRLAEVCATAFAIMAVLSLLAALLMPQWGRMEQLFPGAWRGLWLEKNNLGSNMVVGFGLCAAAAILNPQRRRLWIAFAVLCVVMVLLSTSKTSLVVLILTMAALAVIAVVRRGPVWGVTLTWTAVIGLALTAAVGVYAADLVFEALGKDATLTGRTNIWAGISEVARQRPWTGYGYGAIWDDTNPYAPLARITQVAGFRAGHAHNGWMELWLNLGWGAVILFGLWLAEVWGRSIISIYRGDAGWLAVPSVLGYSLTMLTESITLSWHDVRWVLFVAFAAKLALGEAAQPVAMAALPRRVGPPRPIWP
ncbi:O-antigen ligase [Brevundimonas sp. 2R-24]|uniref:O-antigen ligase n=1 Tax=Peiella sedimenti TaxID=3061083 RepID=A0ABT8SP25_9CAUL|nr:O-antigen ligase [Caulobacteraceae bacterium XZ-24]